MLGELDGISVLSAEISKGIIIPTRLMLLQPYQKSANFVTTFVIPTLVAADQADL